MSEADALCSRIAIMVLGRLQCIGSQQYLKELYGDGYELKFHLRHISYLESVAKFMKDTCPTSHECHRFQSTVRFVLPAASSGLISQVFDRLKNASFRQHTLGIEDWSLCQTSLDEIFVRTVEGAQQQRSLEVNKST
eukprot:TRINITY_DN143499_c0_g4_i1.p1 TRINITY_DN143499_c0_g4~~TRINITY_DN143499_c0_g4_i1.p1  ORF type:complete len:137 (-),score=37.65 TRINITY_DN143499_c0_g4_i1:342-752(-)